MNESARDTIDIDVLFVGGGPASLAGAIRLMQLCRETGRELEVAVIEKGAQIGSHQISGAVMNPVALEKLLPDYRERGCPISGVVRDDKFYYLTPTKAIRLPFVPNYLHNKGLALVSLSEVTAWLGQVAEEMGVMLLPGFAGDSVLFDEGETTVLGVRVGDKGLNKQGEPTGNFEAGPDMRAKVTVFGEGARGSLFGQLDRKLNLSNDIYPQIFEIGIKEVIQLPPDNYFKQSNGNDIHLFGYPLGLDVAGGGFIYEMAQDRVSIGYLVALGYEDPYLDPHEKFLEFKRHPFVAGIIKGGEVYEQGARTVSTGGLYTLPKMVFNGGLVIGASAGIHTPQELKGIHTAMETGMMAAEAIMTAFDRTDFSTHGLGSYQDLFNTSRVKSDMHKGRNFSQALAEKGLRKFIHLAAQYVTGGRGIIDPLKLVSDRNTLVKAPEAANRKKPETDGKLYLDKLSAVYLSKIKHRDDQPVHLMIRDPGICIDQCYPRFNCPCTRFCPANVYEIEMNESNGKPNLILNASNCLHCKTCDIKDPFDNITWTCPEGGSGPVYTIL